MHTHRCVQTQEMHADTHGLTQMQEMHRHTYARTQMHKNTGNACRHMHTGSQECRKCTDIHMHAHRLTMQKVHAHTHTHSYMHADTHARANLENALERCRHTHMQAREHFCNTPFCDFSYWQLFQMKRQNPHPPGPPWVSYCYHPSFYLVVLGLMFNH